MCILSLSVSTAEMMRVSNVNFIFAADTDSKNISLLINN